MNFWKIQLSIGILGNCEITPGGNDGTDSIVLNALLYEYTGFLGLGDNFVNLGVCHVFVVFCLFLHDFNQFLVDLNPRRLVFDHRVPGDVQVLFEFFFLVHHSYIQFVDYIHGVLPYVRGGLVPHVYGGLWGHWSVHAWWLVSRFLITVLVLMRNVKQVYFLNLTLFLLENTVQKRG